MQLVVTRKTTIGPRVVEVALRPPAGDLPAWEPGAHIDLHLPGGLTRQYSLSSDPADLSEYRIAVLLEADSAGGSRYVHESLAAGDTVDVEGPRNHFALLPGASRHVLLAAGIGITPVLAMAEELRRRGEPFELRYCVRDAEHAPYRERVEALAADALHVSSTAGRLDVAAVVTGAPPGARVYCCGPTAFIEAAKAAAAGLPPDTVIYEKFASDQPVGPQEGDQAIDVECVRLGTTVRVGAAESVLAALNRAGAGIEQDCGEGICGTCEVRVLEGEIDHRDEVLMDSEREAGDVMLVCCSRAKGSRLVLDV